MTALVTPEMVAAITGADVAADPERTDLLIEVASDIAIEVSGRPWTPETVPATVQVGISRLVADALSPQIQASRWMKAESIGDYRIEMNNNAGSGINAERAAELFDRYRIKASVTRTPLSMQGAQEYALNLSDNPFAHVPPLAEPPDVIPPLPLAVVP